MSKSISSKPTSTAEWRAALDSLPSTPDNIPAFFIAHGHPGWIWPKSIPPNPRLSGGDGGPQGRPVAFLKDFRRIIMDKYKPKGILIFSAHWETSGERLITDYGNENPLLYDYYGFPKELYSEVTFKSKGDKTLAEKAAKAFKDAGMKARLTPVTEPRGRDGRGFQGPGLDHGCFVPLSIMFPEHASQSSSPLPIPVVQVSIDHSPSSHDHEAIGKAVSSLRKQGILILSGGLTVHTFEDFTAFSEETAKPIYKEWDQAVVDSVSSDKTSQERQQAMHELLEHPGYKLAHPEAEHFLPLYVAAGAGNVDKEGAKVLSGLYGASTIAFGDV